VKRLCAFFVGLLATAACDPPPIPEPPGIDPLAFPEPIIPDDNPLTDAKVLLGKRLFFDVRMSGNGTQSCASCHEPARAFTDGRALPIGSTGDVVPRNSMSLANVAYWSSYTWMNPTLTTLEEQALVPMFGEHPVELGMTAALPEIVQRLKDDAQYPAQFAEAFPDEADPFVPAVMAKALASFERTIVSNRSPYDRYIYDGDVDALNDDEKLGMQLFFSEVTECYHCHGGPFFTAAFASATTGASEPGFQNTGVLVDYAVPNVGLFEFTEDPADLGKMRVPTLRNLGFSAPYFHDGSAATLEDVVDHYMRGGKQHENQSALVRPFTLTDRERAALLAFLRALDDQELVSDPAFAAP
jgi:cytochrome c peroxidase